MTEKIKIQILGKTPDESISLSIEFADEDWQALLIFNAEADHLRHSQLMKRGVHVKLNFHWDIEKGTSDKTELPSDDDIAVLLHRIRPFVLQNEATNFYRICNILHRNFNHPQLQGIIKWYRALFSGSIFQSQCQIYINNTLLNDEKILLDWLNAFQYHRDKEKKQKLEKLLQMLPNDTTKSIFISMLLDKIRAVLSVANMIRAMKNKNSTGIKMKLMK